MDLVNKKCIPCEGGVPPLTAEQILPYLAVTPGWTVVQDGQKIQREFLLQDFRRAMAFVNRVARLAESEGHHPDIAVSYNKVVLVLWTHAIGGLSENDFILAAKIDNLRP